MPINPTARNLLAALKADAEAERPEAAQGCFLDSIGELISSNTDSDFTVIEAFDAWIDAGRPIDGDAEPSAAPSRYSADGFVDVPPYAPDPLDSLFDRMEAALSAALGEVPVENPPKGEPSWEDLLARVARMLPTARREAELYIELRERNDNEGETWFFYWPADDDGIEVADAIVALCAGVEGCEYAITRRDVPGTHVDALAARESSTSYMEETTELRRLDAKAFVAAIDAAREAHNDDSAFPAEDNECKVRDSVLYKGKIRRYQVPE